MFDLNFGALLSTNKRTGWFRDSAEWDDWRRCYDGGSDFIERHLQWMTDREKYTEYERRKAMTPIPTYAKREINRVRNGLFQRFGDIIRRGGTNKTKAAFEGELRGVDNRGASMNSFMGQQLLPDLLVMGYSGVLVDAPQVFGDTLADVPDDFSPFISHYRIENVHLLVPQDNGKRGEWKAVLLRDEYYRSDVVTGAQTSEEVYKYYWIDEATGKVHVQHLDREGKMTRDVVITELDQIPFVLYDIGDSLIKDVYRHQIAILNLSSSDTSYALDSNFPFLTRQKQDSNAAHLGGESEEATIGVRKGMYYGKQLERPGFISPPTDPMRLSLELRRELKNEVRELVMGALSDMGEDGSIDAGLAFIGECLEAGERRILDHWTAFETANPSRRRVPIVQYPDHWCIKTEEERIADAERLLGLMFKIPGRGIKKEIAKLAQDRLLRGVIDVETLDKLAKEIDEAPYCTSDPEIVIPAKQAGLMSGETGALALGGTEDEWKKAEHDQAKRAAAIVAAQADSGAARGAPDLSVDPESAKLEKEATSDADLGGENNPGTRGEGRPIPNLED